MEWPFPVELDHFSQQQSLQRPFWSLQVDIALG